jgi:Asp/Glu/hydantoin racemase
MAASPRIALIHATAVAIDPVRDAFAAGWPAAETVNLLDDSLSVDRAKAAELSAALAQRILDLGRYARRCGADAILYTCSAFGRAIERAARELDLPVLKPNEAMFEAAMAAGDRCGMVATFAPSVAGMETEFAEEAARRRPSATLRTRVVEAAMAALRAGDAATHNRLVADEAARLGDVDAIMLAQFSTARAADAVRARVSVPVLTSPEAAVLKLRLLVEGDGTDAAAPSGHSRRLK